MKYTKEEWDKVLELYQKGNGSILISKITGINKDIIRHRCRQYDLTGTWYTKRKTNVRSNAELKKSVIEAVEQQSLSLDEVTVNYGISLYCLKSWLKKFRHGGYEELLATKPRGRQPKVPKPKRTKGMSELERLREENEYLKAENAYLKKIKGPRPERECRDVRYRAQVIRELSDKHALKHLLKAGGLSRSTYYYNLRKRPDRYADERSRVKAVHAQNRGRYGYRRIMVQLRNEGFSINHKTVYRLMKEENLKNVRKRNKYRSYKGEVGKTAPNILNRDFGTTGPNRKWTTDVTQINIGMEKCYLSPILDMYNGEIVSYTISDHPDLKMVMDMLEKAYAKGHTWKRLILHSDQGWHYQHRSYQKSLQDHKIVQSMSRKGNCLDNAMMENFFGIMKSELLYPNTFNDMDHFKRELRKYIEYYNNDRIKMRLKGMSPVQYRTHNAVLS